MLDGSARLGIRDELGIQLLTTLDCRGSNPLPRAELAGTAHVKEHIVLYALRFGSGPMQTVPNA